MIGQEEEKETAPAEKNEKPAGDKKDEKKEKIKPYEKVITEKAQTQDGLFKVHQVDDKYYYEIPPSQLGKELLLVVTMARSTPGVGYGGQTLANRVIRWEKKGDQILLRSQRYDSVASSDSAIAASVAVSNNPTILMTFPVATYGPDKTPVIEVSPLFTSEITEFSARRSLGARGFDKKRSLVERISAYPNNVEAEASHTYTVPVPSGDRPTPRRSGGMRPGSGTVLVHYSMVALPEQPMTPRLYDERVGYFRIRQYDYSSDEHRAYQKAYITRWRLEKKNPSAKLSEPVKPIVYYVDPATPAKWAPYVKRGIEAWQAAFEEAGFTNAIIAKDPPSKEEDPTWSPEDARYSVVRWVSSTIENAMGPHVHDPRTGEIIESDIKMWHNIMNLLRHWYFVQVAPLDKKAQRLPFPDKLMGQLIEHVTTHEVGHTLGLPHNMKASSQYPIEKVRDKNWVKKMGHTPTLMDYSRFNYVAQPEDGIDAIDLIPRIGPYDKFSIMWGYKPVTGANTAEEERKTLNKWIVKAQEKTPWLRFSTAKSRGSDPGELREAVGDADAVKATELGMKNLNRVMDMLLDAVPQEGKSYDDLDEVYGRVLGQWVREMGHVAALVGGFWSRQKHAGQDGLLFEPVA
ncbi:MAG: zinc-dependent metalloprotease, partial [bacterium]|nr:zinc-dependent metalloprotease [bacterium]